MPSKSKVREAEEKRADLRLRANLSFAENKSVGTFGKSNDTSTGDPDLWRRLKEEEQQELLAQKREQPAFKVIAQQWQKPIDTLQRGGGMLLPDVTVSLPLTDKPVGDVQKTFNDFLDLQKSRNVVYSTDGQNRLILYMGCASRGSHVINGINFHPASDTLDCWLAADRRLVELNAYGDTERAELFDEPQLEVTAEPSANELKELASAEFTRMWGTVWDTWHVSLKTHFGFVASYEQKVAMLRYFENTNMGDPQVWNNCRISLSKAGILPNLLTQEDILCLKMDGKDWDFSRADHRAEFARAKNQTEFGTL